MGGRSSSSSEQSNDVVDRRIGATDNAIVAAENSGVTVNNWTTDFGAISAAGNAITSAVDRAIGGNVQVTTAALSANREVVNDSLGTVESLADNAFQFAAQGREHEARLIGIANQALEDTANLAISKVESATRSDAAQAFETLVRTTALAGAVLGVALIIRARS